MNLRKSAVNLLLQDSALNPKIRVHPSLMIRNLEIPRFPLISHLFQALPGKFLQKIVGAGKSETEELKIAVKSSLK